MIICCYYFFCWGEPETFLFTSPRALKSGKFASFFLRARSLTSCGWCDSRLFPRTLVSTLHASRMLKLPFVSSARGTFKGVRLGSNFCEQPHFRRLLPGAAERPAGGGARNAPGSAAAAAAAAAPAPLAAQPPPLPRQTNRFCTTP